MLYLAKEDWPKKRPLRSGELLDLEEVAEEKV